MGLGTERDEWSDYDWFPTARTGDDEPSPPTESLVARVVELLAWEPGDAPRILLVDLDNLRAGPARLKARMAVVVALARGADHVALAGQSGAVRRSRPHLQEYADVAEVVPDGSDLADVALLERVDELDLPDAQTLIVSNDGIFAELAHCGPLLVLSPGRDALSEALERSATRVVDLALVEKEVVAAG